MRLARRFPFCEILKNENGCGEAAMDGGFDGRVFSKARIVISGKKWKQGIDTSHASGIIHPSADRNQTKGKTMVLYTGNLSVLLTPESSGFVLSRKVVSVADKNVRIAISDLVDDENSSVYLSIDVKRNGLFGEKHLESMVVCVHDITDSTKPRKAYYVFDLPVIRDQIFEEFWDQIDGIDLQPE